MHTEVIRSVARGLRYRPLPHLIGRVIKIHDLATVESAVRRGLRPDLPEECHLLEPALHFREATVAKYGILDLTFSAPAALLEGDALTGIPLLRQLRFLPRRNGEP